MLKTNEYKCEMCGEVNEKGWTDDEAMIESMDIWGVIPLEELGIVCDDCFNKLLMSHLSRMGL